MALMSVQKSRLLKKHDLFEFLSDQGALGELAREEFYKRERFIRGHMSSEELIRYCVETSIWKAMEEYPNYRPKTQEIEIRVSTAIENYRQQITKVAIQLPKKDWVEFKKATYELFLDLTVGAVGGPAYSIAGYIHKLLPQIDWDQYSRRIYLEILDFKNRSK